jgi:AcrR family transcriptional regulator
MSARKVAKAIGVSNPTIYRRLRDPEFAADLKDLQQLSVARAQRILNGGAADAARLMIKTIQGEPATTQQIRAAEITMKLCGMTPPDRLEISGGVSMLSDQDLAAALAAEAAQIGSGEE